VPLPRLALCAFPAPVLMLAAVSVLAPAPRLAPAAAVCSCWRLMSLACARHAGADSFRSGEDDGFDDHLMVQYAEGTAQQILDADIMSIECQHCKLRLGLTDSRAVFARCSMCGKTTSIADARQKQKVVPAKLPQIDLVVQCRRCKEYVGVPKKVATFQCACCGQVNVAGAIRS